MTVNNLLYNSICSLSPSYCQNPVEQTETLWSALQTIGSIPRDLGREGYRLFHLIDEIIPFGAGKLVQIGILVIFGYELATFRTTPQKHPYDPDNKQLYKNI
jgi:hypothetical protein